MHSYLLLLLLVAAYGAVESKLSSENPSRSAQQPSLDSTELTLTKSELLGQIEPAQDSGFVRIDAAYTDKKAIYLRKPTYEAFVRMAQAAAADEIDLQIISATRNFAAQKRIWEAKWNGQRKVDGQDLSQTIPNAQERALKILEYSSMPGTSRHHWGTDLDLNALENSYFESGEGKRIYDWLQKNASTYGFCQVYTEQNGERPYGYQEEKWHWSYLPLASQFLNQYNVKVSYDDLGGFDGGQVAEKVGAIEKYVNGIAPECKEQ